MSTKNDIRIPTRWLIEMVGDMMGTNPGKVEWEFWSDRGNQLVAKRVFHDNTPIDAIDFTYNPND